MLIIATKKEKISARRTLLAAKKLLNNGKNWTQGTLKDENGKLCMLGAVEKAYGPGEDDAKQLLASVIKPGSTHCADVIADFNDNRQRKEAKQSSDNHFEHFGPIPSNKNDRLFAAQAVALRGHRRT